MPPGPFVHPSVVVPRALRTEIVRVALLERLGAAGAEILVLVAPTGYGKTTVLAQHARASGRPALWLSLSDSDSDVDFFLRSLQRAVDSLGVEADLAAEPTPERAVQRLAAALNEDGRRFGVYLDRTELLGPQTGRLLALLLPLLTGHRVFLSGFTAEPLPLARWAASGLAEVIEQEQLGFTAEESAAFLQAKGLGSPTEARELFRLLDGWPAGLALATGSGRPLLEPHDLVREVYAGLPATLQASLPDASVLPEWHEDAARRLELDLPSGWIDTVRRSGLPLTPLGRGWYRPHRLLLSTLDGLLQRDPARLERLHARQAEALSESDPLAALKSALRSRQRGLILALAAQVFPRLRERGEFNLIHDLARQLPSSGLPGWVTEYAAVAQLEMGEIEAGERRLRALHETGETSALGFTALAVLATRRGEFEEQLRLSELGLALFPAAETRTLRLQRAVALISLGRVQEGLRACQDAAREARAQGAALDEANALTMQQYAHQMLQQWSERAAVVQRAYALMQELDQGARTVPLLNILVEEALLSGDRAEAGAALTRAFALAEAEMPVMLPQLYLTQAQLRAAEGQPDAAASALELALAAARRLRLDVLLTFVHFARFELLLAAGQLQDAEEAYQAGERAGHGTPMLPTILPFFAGLRALHRQELEPARTHFSRAAETSPDHAQQLRAQLYLYELQRRDRPLQPGEVRAVAAVIGPLDPAALLALDPLLRPLAAACVQLLPDHPLGGVRSSAADPAGPGAPGPDRSAAPSSAPRLTVRLLGRLEVLADGAAVRLPLAKSAELLAWLAWNGEGSLAELMDALWDGSTSSRHHEYFRVALRRLRASLRQVAPWAFDPVPYDGRRYRLHPELRLDLDAREVLNGAAQGGAALLQALEDYRGDVLPELDSAWIAELRERVRSTLVESALDAARVAEPDGAVPYLRLALPLDPYSEPLNLGLVQALWPRQPGLALTAFRTYARRLRDDLDQEVPGPVLGRLRALGLPLA